jgi:hypothetical protein
MMLDHTSAVFDMACARFLYALVYEQNNGTQVTVLSALVRANMDPWEEAGRLSTMPRATAEAALSAILRKSVDHKWTDSEIEAVSANLIQLLLEKERAGSAMSTFSTHSEVDPSIVWLMWLGLALAVFFKS